MAKQFFDVRETIKAHPETHMFYVVGQGGVGKSYSTKKLLIENCLLHSQEAIYVKRWTTEIQSDMLKSVFDDVIHDPEVRQWWTDSEWSSQYKYFHILHSGSYFKLFGEDEKGKMKALRNVARIVPLSKSQQFKGGTYNNSPVIFFDEFMTDEGYVSHDKEPERLTKIINTVARDDNPAIVIMCGNPDAEIEMCPYLKQLQLDYEHLQPNTEYFFDSKGRDGKILARNVMFIKLANFENGNGGYLSEYTANLWNTPEAEMRITGEAKTSKYMRLPSDDEMNGISAYYELVIETAVVAEDEFNKKIYGYVCVGPNDEAMLLLFRHRQSELREECDASLFCRYEELKPRKHDCDIQILKLNVPPIPVFEQLRRMMAEIDATRFIYSETDRIGTVYEAIKLESV